MSKFNFVGELMENGKRVITELPDELDPASIIFQNDFTVTTKVSEYVTLENGQATIAEAGESLKDLLQNIWCKEIFPKAIDIDQPCVTIDTGHVYKEIGTSVDSNFAVTFNPGSYPYGPETGVTANHYEVKFNGEEVNAASGTFSKPITVTEGACFSVEARVAYIAGPDDAIPVSNLGNTNADCVELKISDGWTDTKTKNLITGFKPNFYGFKSTAVDLSDGDNTDIFRVSGMTDQGSTTTPVTSVTTSNKWKQFFYAVPKGRKNTLSIKDANSNLPFNVIKSPLNVTIKHKDSNTGEYNGKTSEYTVFYIDNAVELSATTLKLTWD